MDKFTQVVSDFLTKVDDIVWGPIMLLLLVGTGLFLTIRTKALCWRNLPYALKSVLSKEARQKKGDGDVSPFSALTTALAATIGTGNIVGVATAMISGGPGALVWMWISAAFGLTSKFSECMLAIKYREVNEKGEMSGGPMYTMKKAFRPKKPGAKFGWLFTKTGAILGWLFALFTVFASFGIGNLTQSNSISSALDSTWHIPTYVTGIIITLLALFIILGGIKSISKVSQVVVPLMAVFYIISGLIVIIGNIGNVPAGLVMIFKMAFSIKSVGGGLCGALVASMTQAIRFGVARGVFSNEAGMGSAAITAAAATTTDPVRQGYINMTGTFWDTIVVCTITGLCIASSGALGSTKLTDSGAYIIQENQLVLDTTNTETNEKTVARYDIQYKDDTMILTESGKNTAVTLTREKASDTGENTLTGNWTDDNGNIYIFEAGNNADGNASLDNNSDSDNTTAPDNAEKSSVTEQGTYHYDELLVGSALTIAAFQTVLGSAGGWLISISIAFFAFSTILGWEYHGEKAFEYLLKTHKYNIIYRIFFSLLAYIGATTTLKIAWTFSDIANALMAIPNLICLLALSGVIKQEMERYQEIIKAEKMKGK